jgi:hypothetical protein
MPSPRNAFGDFHDDAALVKDGLGMYTRARQFPHLSGLSDVEIRRIAVRAMQRHPRYVAIMRTRNIVVSLGAGIAVGLLMALNLASLGAALMIVGAISSAFVLLWNLVWINTVIYRITREEIESPNC